MVPPSPDCSGQRLLCQTGDPSLPGIRQQEARKATLELYYFVFIYFVFSGPHLQHMEAPRLGVELELQLLAYPTATATRDP